MCGGDCYSETGDGTKAAVITVIVQCLIAWVVAFLVHAVGLAFGVV